MGTGFQNEILNFGGCIHPAAESVDLQQDKALIAFG